MENLYDEVRDLFKKSEKAEEICNCLKYTMQHKTGDILYIYRTNREAIVQFWKYVARCRGVRYNAETRKIRFQNNEIICFKSINECKNKLEGCRFKEIRFMEL